MGAGPFVNPHVLSQFKKQKPEYYKFYNFWTSRASCARLRVKKKEYQTSGDYLSIITWSLKKIIYNILWPLGLAALKVEKSSLWYIRAFDFLIERVIWKMFKLQFMIEKSAPNLLTLSTTFYYVWVWYNRVSKTEMGQFDASGNQGIWDYRCNHLGLTLS